MRGSSLKTTSSLARQVRRTNFRFEVALELERTFWERATILHAEHHRDVAKPIRDRFSRRYSDMAAPARHDVLERAPGATELRQRVADWKPRFFAAGWARYDLAKLAAALRADPDLEFCGEAASPASAPTSLSALPPECFVVHLPERGRNSGALTKRLKAHHRLWD